jgi:glycosyltransferase involved in cell wall biosynthesis
MSWKKTLARVYGAVDTSPEGYVDGVEDNVVKGWAFDPADPGRTVEVELLVDGAPKGAHRANRFRADLHRAGKGDGNHGFEIPLPSAAADGRRHTLVVRVAGLKRALRGTPRPVVAHGAASAARSGSARGTFFEGLPPPADLVRDVAPPRPADLPPVSAVIATYNRGAFMEETLRRHIDCARGLEVEFLVIDDGSADDTPLRLKALAAEFPNLRHERVPNGGAGQARNVACAMARHDIVLFLGDDIRPACPDYYVQHMRAHYYLPQPEVAVLGKMVWPHSAPVNFVMSHVQGAGQEQFGFFAMMPYTWVDWRFFYTSNVSFKRSAVADWSRDGFSREFPIYGWEDVEFAYRLHKKFDKKFRILYTPAPVATHHHPLSVERFLDRQTRTGLMARVFSRLHPELASDIQVDQVDAALAEPAPAATEPVDDYMAMVEGIKSWAKLVDAHRQLGSRNWHGDFLKAVFELAYLHGVVMGYDKPCGNFGAAYRLLLNRFQDRMRGAADFEVLGRMFRLPVV